MARPADTDETSVDRILQNLTKRPNVRSTLILSRKDGSIIKTSGAISEEANEGAGHARSYSSAEPPSSPRAAQSEEGSAVEGTDGEKQKSASPTASPAQVLASSIYSFVASAAVLGATLHHIDHERQSFAGRTDSAKESSDAKAENVSPGQGEDVQLLRLRLKKQEIIIFPDPNYLCCVVQDLEKNPR